jgi:hypothetical protein
MGWYVTSFSWSCLAWNPRRACACFGIGRCAAPLFPLSHSLVPCLRSRIEAFAANCASHLLLWLMLLWLLAPTRQEKRSGCVPHTWRCC